MKWRSKGAKILSLQAVTIPPQTGQPPQGLLVALHGWGANAQDLVGLAPMLKLPNYQMIFPDAPFPFPHALGGKMWYNFPENFSFQKDPTFRDRPDLTESRHRLTDWLLSLEDLTGIPLSRTVLAGFSQGGAMTLDVGINLPLAALMALSGYLHAPPLIASLGTNAPSGTKAQKVPPVLMVHGRQDAVVPLSASHQARNSLIAAGVGVQYHELDMGHEIRPVVLEIMQSFIEENL